MKQPWPIVAAVLAGTFVPIAAMLLHLVVARPPSYDISIPFLTTLGPLLTGAIAILALAPLAFAIPEAHTLRRSPYFLGATLVIYPLIAYALGAPAAGLWKPAAIGGCSGLAFWVALHLSTRAGPTSAG